MTLTEESFEALLAWLEENREAAGRKYEAIRGGLIRMFASRGFSDAEDLADLTINRVIARLPDIRNDYVGEPANYFHGVARKILLEAGRRKEIPTDAAPPARLSHIINTSDEYECLLKCLELLTLERRDLILDYYLYDKQDKIIHHKSLAQELGITESTLRVRAHRIREKLETCVAQCVKKTS